MDTSEKYIKMCEGMKKIQESWEPKIGDYYAWAKYSVRKKGTVIIGIVKYYDKDKKLVHGMQVTGERRYKGDVIWLPRQDQLQERAGGLNIHSRFIWFCYETGKETLFAKDGIRQFLSYEQLWFAFVMYEKYGKVWNDGKEEWIED